MLSGSASLDRHHGDYAQLPNQQLNQAQAEYPSQGYAMLILRMMRADWLELLLLPSKATK